MKGMNTKLLNTIKDELIRIANEKGIVLQDTFGTPEKFKQMIISLTIDSVMQARQIPLDQAYDIVMGDGAYQDMAGRVFNILQEQHVVKS